MGKAAQLQLVCAESNCLWTAAVYYSKSGCQAAKDKKVSYKAGEIIHEIPG